MDLGLETGGSKKHMCLYGSTILGLTSQRDWGTNVIRDMHKEKENLGDIPRLTAQI